MEEGLYYWKSSEGTTVGVIAGVIMGMSVGVGVFVGVIVTVACFVSVLFWENATSSGAGGGTTTAAVAAVTIAQTIVGFTVDTLYFYHSTAYFTVAFQGL